MSAPARAFTGKHIHLPSIHIRGRDGTGFDYDEDIYIRGRRAECVVRLAVIEGGRETLVRETFDELCGEDLERLKADLTILMDEGNPAATAVMEECARKEFARQRRIAAGKEGVCRRCGCSETRACSGGCVWATAAMCSRCA